MWRATDETGMLPGPLQPGQPFWQGTSTDADTLLLRVFFSLLSLFLHNASYLCAYVLYMIIRAHLLEYCSSIRVFKHAEGC